MVSLSWEPPERDNGAAIDCYAVEMSSLAGRARLPSSWTTAYVGPEASCTVCSLARKDMSVREKKVQMHPVQ